MADIAIKSEEIASVLESLNSKAEEINCDPKDAGLSSSSTPLTNFHEGFQFETELMKQIKTLFLHDKDSIKRVQKNIEELDQDLALDIQ